MVVLILLLVFPLLNPDDADPPPAAGATQPAGAGGVGGVDLSSMTPRQAADRLYERVMQAAEGGDTAQVNMFMPMAVAAYDQVEEKDADAYFHVSLLQRTAGRHEDALATAREGLELYPDHLLNLAAAGAAAAAAGDDATAREFYGRYVAVYDVEAPKPREDYQGHAQLLPTYLQTARDFSGG